MFVDLSLSKTQRRYKLSSTHRSTLFWWYSWCHLAIRWLQYDQYRKGKCYIFQNSITSVKGWTDFRNMCYIFETHIYKKKNDQFVKNGDLFSQLYKSEWSVKISSVSSRTLADLPLTENFLKVREYLHISISKHCVKSV